jgi:hypothetical protein
MNFYSPGLAGGGEQQPGHHNKAPNRGERFQAGSGKDAEIPYDEVKPMLLKQVAYVVVVIAFVAEPPSSPPQVPREGT